MKLVTSGCSFSEIVREGGVETWPLQLEKELKLNPKQHIALGTGSQGNGLIARRLIHALTTLDNYDDVLVGVMWSGPNRAETYTTNKKIINKLRRRNVDNWVKNPIAFVPNAPGGWVIHNVHWGNAWSKQYYYYYDEIQGHIETYEWILYVQMFLEQRDIKYFMVPYTNEVLAQRKNKNTQHLVDLINWNSFVTDIGCYEWCRDKSGLEMPVKGDNHPSSDQHQRYTDQILIPWLNQQKYIDTHSKR